MRARGVTNVANVGERDAVTNKFHLRPPRVITGTPYVEASLHRSQSYGDGSDVNVLFVNILTNESRWLFEGTGQQILGSHWMFDRVAEARTAVGAFYIVGDRDTNVALVAVAADGTNSRKLIEGIEKVYSVKQVVDDKALVLYLKDEQAMSALFSLPSMALLMQAKLPDWGRATSWPARTD